MQHQFGLIGYPISHSLSPQLFAQAYSDCYQYNLIETPDFNQAWEEFLLNYQAVNVTAPFKEKAYNRADILSPEALRVGATNLCVKTDEGIKAYNSDYLGVKNLLEAFDKGSAAIIGFGGAGKAALAAAEDLGFAVQLYRHDEIANGVRADLIVYTLPCWVEGAERLDCNCLIEANYRNPILSQHPKYISGKQWLVEQAKAGYELMTGEKVHNNTILI